MRRSVFLCAVIGLIGLIASTANAEPSNQPTPAGNVDGITIVYDKELFSEAELERLGPRVDCKNGKPFLTFAFYSLGTGEVIVTTTESIATGGSGQPVSRTVEVKDRLTIVDDIAVSGSGVNVEIALLGNGPNKQTRQDHFGGIQGTAHEACDSASTPEALKTPEGSAQLTERKRLGWVADNLQTVPTQWWIVIGVIVIIILLSRWVYRYTH